MSWPQDHELELLVKHFQLRTLPKGDWSHQAHLAVGTWHVHRFGPSDALVRLRSDIRSLNDAHGTPNSDTEGYHETITRAYVALIAGHIAAQRPGTGAAECARLLLASPLAERAALTAFWSPAVLMSTAARREWVEPDLRPLSSKQGNSIRVTR